MDETEITQDQGFVEITADVVAAYVANNSVRATDLPDLIVQVHAAFAALSAPAAAVAAPEAEKVTPAQIRRSITPDALISFIDGKPYKTLKRHLGVHGLDFEGYRARYGLPADYPSVAASYSKARSSLARSFGLGKQRRSTREVAA